MSLQNRWLLILGSNSDIAKQTARRFAKEGWNVYLASRNIDQAEAEAAHIKIAFKVDAKAIRFDACDYESHNEFYSALEPKPEGVVLCFGTLGDQINSQANFGAAKQVIETNFLGAVSMLEIVAADFEKRQSGFIVAVGSVAGDRGRKSNYIYGSSKAALAAHISGLRHRLFASKVSVLLVKPGFVATKMTARLELPAALTAEPQEVANAIHKAVLRKRSTIYIKPIWRLIMAIIVHLPTPIFNRTKL